MQHLSITVDESPDGTCRVVLSGEIDIASAPELSETLEAQIDAKVVTIDFADVTFIDSSGLRTLVRTQRARPQGSLRLVGMQENVRKVFEITGLDEVFPPESGAAEDRTEH